MSQFDSEGASAEGTMRIALLRSEAKASPNAASAGGAEYAPAEMLSSRQKLAQANKAMLAKDYKQALTLADQAQADAKLAQGKANSAKAQAAADALQEDIRVLREELERNNH